jgi:hypothetical protein
MACVPDVVVFVADVGATVGAAVVGAVVVTAWVACGCAGGAA